MAPLERRPSEGRKGRKSSVTKAVPFLAEANNPRRLKVGNLSKSSGLKKKKKKFVPS